MKALIVFYSMYGHVYQLARAVEKGVVAAGGIDVEVKQAPETLPEAVLEKMGAVKPRQAWADVPVAKAADLGDCDALFLGAPTRFGGICGQMRQFLDATGGLWAKGAMVGKIGAGFTSSGTQHGGQEMTLVGSLYPYFMHHGMLAAGLPYTYQGQSAMDEVLGGSPYGASTIAAPDGSRQPSRYELDGAEFLGRHVALLTKKLRG